MEIVNPKKGVLCTPFGTWHPGDPFIPAVDIPEATLKSWRDSQHLIYDAEGPTISEFPEDNTDIFSKLNRKQLLRVIKENELNKGDAPIKPMTTWQDEAIRQAIRQTNIPPADLLLDGKPLSTFAPENLDEEE